MAYRTIKQKQKQKPRSAFSLACCVGRGGGESNSPTTYTQEARSSSGWMEEEVPVLRQKCPNLRSRMRRGRRGGGAAEFRYDLVSYAMNFEDGKGGGVDEPSSGLTNLGFVARLPRCRLPEAGRSSEMERV